MARRRGATDDQERERARTIYRRINPRVHGSEDYLALSSAPSGRALWLFLLSCREMTRIPGVILAGPLALAESIEWEPADFDRCLGEILDRGMAKIDRRARVLWLTHALAEVDAPTESDVIGWRRSWANIPPCPLRSEIRSALEPWLRSHGLSIDLLEKALPVTHPRRASGLMTYFVREMPDGPVKIGFTNDVARRFAALRTSSARPLALLAVLSGNHEREMHARFASWRIRGEWFAPAPELVAFIESIAAEVE